jgi:acetyl esterase/lipase
MSFLNILFGFLKKLAIFFLIVSIAISLRYGSIDYKYLTIRVLHSLLSLKHSFIPDPARPTLTADYEAFESLLKMTPAQQYDPLADPLIVTKKQRSGFNLGHLVPKPSQCQINKEVFQYNGHSVDTYWVDNHREKFQRNPDKILLYFHGGGYYLGNIHGQ